VTGDDGRFSDWLQRVIDGGFLTREQARAAMSFLMSGTAAPAQVGALLAALQTRGHCADELAGFAEAMRDHATTVAVDRTPLVDTCGTGGDGLHTFNFSTAAALVAAGAGVAVAKHGNRAVSSRSGSADVLEALGVDVTTEPDQATSDVERIGFGFFFAPRYHPAMRHVAPVRRALGVRTVFNLLGPLANPARVRRQVVGVYGVAVARMYAEVLARLGVERALVVHGDDGMDELTLAGPTTVHDVARDGAVTVSARSPGRRHRVQRCRRTARSRHRDHVGRRRAGRSSRHRRRPGTGRPRGTALGRSTGFERGDMTNDGMPSILRDIADATRRRVAAERAAAGQTAAGAPRRRTPTRFGRPSFRRAFDGPGLHVVAEVKLASPSAGSFGDGLDPLDIARQYLAHGAAALSVLTEPDYFKGDVAHLQAIAGFAAVPLLMKDFFLDEWQLDQAAAAGASAVLLIVAMLDDETLSRLHRGARERGLEALVEVHDEAEPDRALLPDADLVGVNNRNLHTLQVSLDTARRLAARARDTDATLICESGLSSHQELQALRDIGYDGFLVGSSLVRSGRPGAALAALLGRGGA